MISEQLMSDKDFTEFSKEVEKYTGQPFNREDVEGSCLNSISVLLLLLLLDQWDYPLTFMNCFALSYNLSASEKKGLFDGLKRKN